MRNRRYITLTAALALLLLSVLLFVLPGVGPGALDSEKVFIAGLHNSLYYLDQAKEKWAEEKRKSEGDVPAMTDLMPYLGDWTNRIDRFVALGITYKLTPISETEPQSDVATLTRDLYFRAAICRFYPAGTTYCIHTGWTHPDSANSFRAFYVNNRELLAAAAFIAGIITLLIFAATIRKSTQASNIAAEPSGH